jgi:hypothetical protein
MALLNWLLIVLRRSKGRRWKKPLRQKNLSTKIEIPVSACSIKLRQPSGWNRLRQGVPDKGELAIWLVQTAQQPSAVKDMTALNVVILLKKLPVSQHVRKFQTYYLIRKFVAVFTKSHHGLLFWTRRIDSKVSHPYFNIHFNIILPLTPRSSSFPSKLTMLETSEPPLSASDWVTLSQLHIKTTYIQCVFLQYNVTSRHMKLPLGSD